MQPEPGYLRIATEEAFAPPELITMWQSMLADGTCDDPGFVSLQGFYLRSKAERPAAVLARLQDLGQRRIADMDAAGIDRQVISLTSPGVQVLDRDRAVAMATLANDQLADACRRHPDRFSGLTAIAPQDPKAAATEIERGARELGLVGVIVNSHTQGEYLDDKKFWPIFEAAQALDMPIYLHPNTPSRNMIGPMLDAGLDGAIFGFAVETGMHLLRIITAGVFDRFPGLRIVVGHLGEALPFWLYRLDYMHAATVRAERYESMKPIARRPSEYLRSNVWVTTSGMPWAPAIMFCREVLGPDRVMYAMDYPYEYVPEEVTMQEELPIGAAAKKAFFQRIAEQVFALLCDRWGAVGVEGLDGFQPPGLALGPFGLGPGDRAPVRRQHQPRDRVAQLDPVAARLVDIKEERLLDRMLVRPRLDEHALVQADVRRAQDVLAAIWRERDVVKPPGAARPVLRVHHVVTLVGEVQPLPGDRAVVQHDLLGDPPAEHVADEVAAGRHVAGQVVHVVKSPYADAAPRVGLGLVLQRQLQLGRRCWAAMHSIAFRLASNTGVISRSTSGLKPRISG
jgi:5-carboxyvanillate decarboxylase